MCCNVVVVVVAFFGGRRVTKRHIHTWVGRLLVVILSRQTSLGLSLANPVGTSVFCGETPIFHGIRKETNRLWGFQCSDSPGKYVVSITVQMPLYV